ncbi:retrovirus-related pol polyprotein from transposon TNT 1-94 [Tanacetum coccineum]|uniref:Retrovirus-related pol polyprotein from transposon TNT 1-94 n=1 Tax=Tanacetum coccineum TaxID=301880 RepID=A0ABQ4Y1I9_9ASTR
MKGLSECKALESNVNCIQVKDIVKEAEDHLKTYSSAEMDISWFHVFLDGLEPYLLKTLEDVPFVPMSSLSTTENPLPKRQNQWSNAESRLANQDKRLKSIIISCLPNDVMKSILSVKIAKEIWNDLILAHEGPSDTRDTNIAALRLKFNAFKSLKGEKVMGTFTRMKCLLNDLENNSVTIPQAEVNATFVNSLPRKWLRMNQTQRANNFIKNDSLATLDSGVEEDQRTSNEFLDDLNAEYHERALLANQKRFYKRSGRVGSARKPIDKTKETCFACEKIGYFQKDCHSNKTSTPFYPSSNNSFNKFKSHTPPLNQTSSQNTGNYQKDYKGKYKGLKAEMTVLTQRIDDLTKEKSEKGKNDKGKCEKELIAESFDWDEESVSLEDEGTTRIRAFMAIAEDEPSVGKVDARSGQWVDITMKKVHRLLSMTNSDDRKHVLDYTHVDLIYVEDQRKNMVNKYNHLKQELSLHKSELSNLKNTVSIKCSLQNEVIRVNLENESLKDEIPDLKKADVSTSEFAPIITSDSEDDCDIQKPLPPLPKLTGAVPSGASKMSQTYVIKKKTESKHPAVQRSCPDKNALPSSKQLLLTLMKEVKGIKNQILIPSDTSLSVSQADSSKTLKQKIWYGPCKHCGMKNHLSDDCYSKPKCSTCGSISHTTKEHTKQTAVRKSLNKLKGQSTSKSTPIRTTRMPKTFSECKYCGSNKHHPDDCEFYPGCEICRSIAHEIVDCPKNLRNNMKQRVAIKQSEPTEKFAYVNGLKHNLISISQLCDANFKVLFTKTQGTIFSQKDKVVLIAPKRRDVYVIDMSSFNKDNNACFLAKASPSHVRKGSITEPHSKQRDHFPSPSLYISFTWICLDLSKPQTISHNKYTLVIVDEYSRKIENLNEVRVKELRSDNGTEFRNHKLEEFYDEKVNVKVGRLLWKTWVVFLEHSRVPKVLRMAINSARCVISRNLLNFKSLYVLWGSRHKSIWFKSNSPNSLSCSLASLRINSNLMILVLSLGVRKLIGFNKRLFHQFEEVANGEQVYMGNDGTARVIGFQIKQDSKGISICQEKYVNDLLKKYDLADCASIKCPMLPPNNLGPDELGVSVNETLFRGMIGSLMYLTASRPDIQFSTCLCARYQANPKESYLVVVKRIFKYLKGTPSLGLWYPKGSGFDLKAYSDSDYARCNLDRKSTSGGCQILGGKLVCWSAKKQSFVAMSSAEAEYVAAAGCCAQVLWIKSQLAVPIYFYMTRCL